MSSEIQNLIEEVRMLRRELGHFKTEVSKEFSTVRADHATKHLAVVREISLFKGKAFGFLAVISVIFNGAIEYFKKL